MSWIAAYWTFISEWEMFEKYQTEVLSQNSDIIGRK